MLLRYGIADRFIWNRSSQKGSGEPVPSTFSTTPEKL